VIEAEWQEKAINPESGGPEYETIGMFGSDCGITDPYAIAYASQMCNEYGADTITAGATMAFAIDCYEHGIISSEETGGIELKWGDADAMVAMLEATLKREGFGNVLAEGSAAAAEQIGNGAEDFVVASKRQELPAHMPQVKPTLGVIYAVNPFGADHQSSEHDPMYTPGTIESSPDKYAKRMADIGLTDPQPGDSLNEEKVRYALTTQYAYSAMDTADVCQFVYGPAWQLMGFDDLAGVVTAVTGMETTVDDLLDYGRRRVNLLRAFNAREGITRESDTLPKRLYDDPLEDGPNAGATVDRATVAEALEVYYRLAGWDPETGNPTRTTLEDVGLSWVADELNV
jgi:aldehyde:ferredoxin oxidoreductase